MEENLWERVEPALVQLGLFERAKRLFKTHLTVKEYEKTLKMIEKAKSAQSDKTNLLENWALAIKRHEGWITPADKNPKYPNGSPSFRNNNPGNLRYNSYTASLGENRGASSQNFTIYATYEIGFNALKQFLIDACSNALRSYKGTMTLLEFYQHYAPTGDGNYPKGYATAVANDLKVSINTQIKDLLVNNQPVKPGIIDQIADAIVAPPIKGATIYSQRDKMWANIKLGFGQTTIGGYGCKLTVASMIDGRTPDILNEVLKKGGAFYGDLLDDVAMARVLGWQFLGRDYNINNEPNWSPTMKEVDMSPATGKQQHFVARLIDEKGGRYIIDPWTGQKQKIAFYPFVSYRRFKKEA